MREVAAKTTGDTLPAIEWEEGSSRELQNAVESAGLTLSELNLNQLGETLAIYAATSDFYTDSGSVNSHVLSPIGSRQAPPSLTDGVRVRFIAGNTNTGASTVNLNTIGVKDLVEQSAALPSGRILAGSVIEAVYVLASDKFEITSIATDFNQPLKKTDNVTFNQGTFIGDLLVGTNSLVVDASLGEVGIGRPPENGVQLAVDKSMNIISNGSAGSALIRGHTDAVSASSVVILDRSRNTEAAPTAVQLLDRLGAIRARGYDGTSFQNNGNHIDIVATENWTPIAQGNEVIFNVQPNGSSGGMPEVMTLTNDRALVMSGTTGGSQGQGTINAKGVYDDGVLLTCYVTDMAIDGVIDQSAWDDRVPNRGEEIRTHEPAARFAARANRDLDPNLFYEDFTTRRALPNFPTRDEWASDGPLSSGEVIQRLWESLETQAVHVNKLLKRIEVLESA